MDFGPTTLLQILILAVGIYLLLAFLRSTRGSGLVRGLGLMLIVGVYGLWAVSGQLGLNELNYVIKGLLGFVFVILAIVFQTELRRGIVTLGENPLLGRLLRRQRDGVLSEVAAAAVSMAKKKQGALIAFERKTPLDTYVEGGVKLDAEVNRYLLESLFHHGNVLHDGAVVVRGDRVVAAASLFPLTENIEISKSTGTRHRAALGLTEETDAVTVAVSEETGLISICKGGKMERRVPRAQLAETLVQRLGEAGDEAQEEVQEGDDERAPLALRVFTEHLGQKFAALVLGFLVWYGAHQDLRFERDKEFTVVPLVADSARAVPGQITVLLEPGWGLSLAKPTCSVSFEGTREQLEALAQAGGVVKITDEGPLKIGLNDVDWTPLLPGLSVRWREPLSGEVQGLTEQDLELSADMIEVLDGDLNPRYEALRGQLGFSPRTARVRGPRETMADLALAFEPLVLGLQDTAEIDRVVSLAQDLRGAGIQLLDQVRVTLPVVLREDDLGPVRLPITLQWVPEGLDFQPPGKEAEFQVYGRGLFEGQPTPEQWQTIKGFVERELRAFIAVDEISAGSQTGRVAWVGLEDWRERLAEQIDDLDPQAQLRVVLTSEPEIVLDIRDEQ